MSRTARDIMDLGLDVGTAMLSNGASVASAIKMSRRVMQGRGASEVQVDVTSSSIVVTVRQDDDTDPVTALRVVPVGHHDFTRITQVEAIAKAEPALTIAEARARLRSVVYKRSRWRNWDVTAGYAIIAGAAAMMLGAAWIIGAVAVCSGLAIHRLQLWLARYRVSMFFQQAVGGAVAALIAAFVAVIKTTGVSWLVGVSPGLIVIGNVISMLAGLAILGAAEDAIAELYVTGVAHALQAIVITVGLVAGVSVIIGVGTMAGLPIGHRSLQGPDAPSLATICWGGIVALGYGIASRSSRRAIVAAGLIGGGAWGLLLLLSSMDWPSLAGSGVAAVFVGSAAGISAKLLKVQLDSISTSAVVPLLPGLATYEGLRSLALGQGLLGQDALLEAAAVAFALAAGVAAGAAGVRPLARPITGLKRFRKR